MDTFNELHTELAEQEAANYQAEQVKLTVHNPTVGDRLECPACGDALTLTPMDGWCGPHVSCVNGTVHTDWIITTGRMS